MTDEELDAIEVEAKTGDLDDADETVLALVAGAGVCGGTTRWCGVSSLTVPIGSLEFADRPPRNRYPSGQ